MSRETVEILLSHVAALALIACGVYLLYLLVDRNRY